MSRTPAHPQFLNIDKTLFIVANTLDNAIYYRQIDHLEPSIFNIDITFY